MMLTIASGKGGTGKTTFSVNLAYTLAGRGERVRLLDCDVEEPNCHLFVKPRFTETSAVSVPKPVLAADRCDGCGECAKACRYNAIAVIRGKALLFPELCHACGVCSFVCPRRALSERATAIGKVMAAPNHEPFHFAHGLLNVGETLAPTVVAAVKSRIAPDAVNILDAAPGTACPVVKALGGADAAVLVTEPTPFGLHDLRLAAAMALQMRIPTGIVVNRSETDSDLIADFARSSGIPILGRIPFRREYARTYSSGDILVHKHPELAGLLLGIFEQVHRLVGVAVPPVPRLEDFQLAPGAQPPLPTGAAPDHRELTIISGKGGTGKTTVTASFAVLAGTSVLADNDVDAADLHLLLASRVREVHEFTSGQKAVINPAKCICCGKCEDACHFGAISMAGRDGATGGKVCRVDPVACEGCGFCPRVCPADAIQTQSTRTGQWFVSETDRGPMVHARLGIAEENSGRLVMQVRSRASDMALELRLPRILGDGPPGTGCPVIASVSGTDLVLVVTEPTVSGAHDMERVLELAAHFSVGTLVIINKADLNPDQTARIEEIARVRGARVIGRIPFDRAVHDALMAGKTVVEYSSGPAANAIRAAWREVAAVMETT